MDCPRCEGAKLESEVWEATEVDRCPKCEGLWLDLGEGEDLSRPEELPEDLVAQVGGLAKLEAPEPDDSPPLTCPRCSKEMTRERYADSHVEIDRCACGVWLDKGELGTIATYRAQILKNLTDLQKDAEKEAGRALDLSFAPEVLEKSFARIYFDKGKADTQQEMDAGS